MNRLADFTDDYIVDPITGCWVWQGAKDRRGYGHCRREGRKGGDQKAHRWYYEQVHGRIPVGLELDHLCSNPPCVNPAHLEPVTRTENARRGAKTKLSAADVTAIRENTESTRKTGERFGIHPAHVSRIRTGKRWSEEYPA